MTDHFKVMGFERNRYDGGIAVYDSRKGLSDGMVAEFPETGLGRAKAEALAAKLNAGPS